jgi:RNA polymerase sigma-70 factor (ECF subfamily)
MSSAAHTLEPPDIVCSRAGIRENYARHFLTQMPPEDQAKVSKPGPTNGKDATDLSSTDLAQLLTRVGGHQDRTAFAALFGHFAPRLKSYLIRLGSSNDMAEELVQDVMLLVWRKAGQYDPDRAAASTWIYTIARNRRIDVLRRERRPELDSDDPLVETVEPPAGDDVIQSRQNRTLLKKVLAELPEEQAVVVTKSFIEDKSHSMIAEELDLPLGTVKSRLRLAFKRIREKLGDQL